VTVEFEVIEGVQYNPHWHFRLSGKYKWKDIWVYRETPIEVYIMSAEDFKRFNSGLDFKCYAAVKAVRGRVSTPVPKAQSFFIVFSNDKSVVTWVKVKFRITFGGYPPLLSLVRYA